MSNTALKESIDTYVERVWDDILADIASLIAIRSVEDLSAAEKGAPWGPGPKAALKRALEIAEKLGLRTHDCEGYLGYADVVGRSDMQLATIAHVDIVPEGPDWTVDPFSLTRKEGYLMGRGVLDDKGPFVLSLYAAHYFAQMDRSPRYTIRCLIGCNEETGMGDVEYYQKNFAQPSFLFTPDSEFPLCCGEKGHLAATFTYPVEKDGSIISIEGGSVENAVAGAAHAIVRYSGAQLKSMPGIRVRKMDDERIEVTAQGKGGHASMPEGTVNAIGLLVDALLEWGICSASERRFLEFEHLVLSFYDGSGLGIAVADDAFGPLTCIGGIIEIRDGMLAQTIDCRYPTSTSGQALATRLRSVAENYSVAMVANEDMPPFYIEPTAPEIQTLLNSYREYADNPKEPFTIGGGTYARHFDKAVSFGPNEPDSPDPSWVGSEHGPDEAFSEERLKRALKIYIYALDGLMKLDLQ